MSDRLEVTYALSPWAREFLLTRESDTVMPCYRRGHRVLSVEQLRARLARAGLPFTDAIAELECNLGGCALEDGRTPYGLGVSLSLDDAPDCSPVAARFRGSPQLFATDDERLSGPEGWSYLPLRGTGYPRVFFQGRALVPAGMTGQEHVYFLGERGEVYLFVTTLDQLYLVAGSGRTWIERCGLVHRKRGRAYWELHICGDVGAHLAEALHAPKFAPACDEYFTVWASDEAQIRVVHDVSPNIFGTHVSTTEPDELLRALRKVLQGHRHGPLRVWSGANNIDDLGGMSVLTNAGIEAEVLFGPGPGNFDYSIDPDTGEECFVASTYDSSRWR
jgi:hypothetical protein